MGESVTEGTIARWVKAVGDPVKEGETVVEVTTDKVDVEVPSTATGRLAEILAAEGATVEVGGALATVAIDASVSDGDGAAPASSAPETPQPARAPEPLQPVARPQPPAAPAATSPLARRRAAIHGIDLHGADGTPQVAEGETPDVIRGPAAALVEHMERSRDIPTATSFRTIAVDVLEARRRELNTALSADELQGATITLTNPGGIGTVASVPRLMPGQGAIIAVGALGYPAAFSSVSEPRLRDLGVRKVMTMTSTYDHRIIQGAQSGEFLARVEALLAGADGFYENVFASLGLSAPSTLSDRPTADAVLAPLEAAVVTPSAQPDRAMLAAMQAATSLVKAHRTHGHLGAHLDPLGTPPIGDPAMDPVTYGLTPELMARIPADLLRVYVPGKTLADVLPALH